MATGSRAGRANAAPNRAENQRAGEQRDGAAAIERGIVVGPHDGVAARRHGDGAQHVVRGEGLRLLAVDRHAPARELQVGQAHDGRAGPCSLVSLTVFSP